MDDSPQDSTPSTIQQPDIDPKTGKINRPAVSDGAQAWSIFKALRDANLTRNDLNSEIVSRFNGKLPRIESTRSTGEAWKSNFPTGFMEGIISTVVPTLTSFIESAQSYTQSHLDDDTEEARNKSELAQEAFTKKVRSWRGWRSFCYALCQEVILIGYAFSAWTDEYEWRPTFYRQDQARIPDGSEQFSEYVQTLGIDQSFLIHELVDVIDDRKSAEAAGWNVDNVIEALNNAMPDDPNRKNTEGSLTRTYEDMMREGNIGSSFSTGARVVDAGHLLVIEPDEGVSHFILDRNNSNNVLFDKHKRFDSMSEVVVLFTLEPGNGKFYSSKGLGRRLLNLTIAIDNTVNEAVDQLRVASLLIVQWDNAGKTLPPPRVKAPFMMIDPNAKFDQKAGFQANVSAFIELHNKLLEIAQQAVGAYIQGAVKDATTGDKTATQARVDYQRELKSTAAFISRFAGQLAEMFQEMQKRLCNPDTTDDEAKDFQKQLKEYGFSKAEIKEWAESSVAEVLQDLTQGENNAKIAIAEKFRGNPNFDQIKLDEIEVTAMIGGNPSFAKEVMLAEGIDPTMEVEQVREQIMENEAIIAGASIPVSPRDNDEVHLKVLIPELMKGGQAMAQNPQAVLQNPGMLDHVNAAIIHGQAHLQSWEKKGAQPDKIAPYEQALKKADDALTGFAGNLQKMKGAQQQPQQPQQSQQQPQAPQSSDGDVDQGGAMSEKTLVAWISKYEALPGPERARLEAIGGIGPQPGEPPMVDTPPLNQEKQENITVSHPGVSTATNVTKIPQAPPQTPSVEQTPVVNNPDINAAPDIPQNLA